MESLRRHQEKIRFIQVRHHYLGNTGYAAQQTCEPEDPNRLDNLWAPIEGDHSAHGTFDIRAHETSWELRAGLERKWIGGGLA